MLHRALRWISVDTLECSECSGHHRVQRTAAVLRGTWRTRTGGPEAQMEDLEKETLRWWFSPKSWLWNSISDSMASSTEPIWIRAILWSFLRDTPAGHLQTPHRKLKRTRRVGGRSLRTRGEYRKTRAVGLRQTKM